MSHESVQARAIFNDVVENVPPERWQEYLGEACGANQPLRDKVQRLLDAHGAIGSFMDKPAAARVPTVDPLPTERPGTQIGPYKLLQQIGEGGMGVVYMAEQSHPVERRVALKIIKPGMDTRHVIARFEAEEQALAMMDHPNIAKVLDAGTTDAERPYFVMELVRGIPITKYCDEQHLTPKERLELFIPICQAVQHAHQKGIIHRDIKPSNILVALYDGQPVPKVIDFGVAKATSQKLTEKTMFTQYGQVVGTLEYMAPEQAQMNQLDIDTRSDIYSLGVVLYELLTGNTPFDRKRLRSAAFDEMMRIIREEDPPRPSLRLSTSDTLPSVAANRRIEPKKLSTLVRGELDWIVMKALEKERARRYGTAAGFANDIQRYLDDETVEACPPSATYRFQKFARKNKAALLTTAILLLALLLGVVGTSWQAVVAVGERNRALEAESLADKRLDRAERAEQLAVDEAERARALAEREKMLAEGERAARMESQQHLYDASMNLIQLASEEGQRAQVLRLLELCRAGHDIGSDRSLPFEWRYWWRQCHHYSWSFPRGDGSSRGDKGIPNDSDHVAVSPDGKVVVIARVVWDLTTGKRIGTLYYDGEKEAISRYDKLKEAARRNPDDAEAQEAKDAAWKETAFNYDTDGILFSPDGKFVAAKKHTAVREGDAGKYRYASSIHLFDMGTLDQIRTISLEDCEGGFGCNFAVAFSPDSSLLTAMPYLIATDRPQEVSVWEVATGKVRLTVKPSGDRCPGTARNKSVNYTRTLAFSRDGRLLATAGHDENGRSRTQLWDIATGQCVKTLWARDRQSVSMKLVFLADNKRLLAQSSDDEVTVWDLTTGEIDASAPTPIEGNISPDGRRAVARGSYGGIDLWDVVSGEKLGALLGHNSDYFWHGFSQDGNWLVSVDDQQNEIRVWDLRTNRAVRDHSSITDLGPGYGYNRFAFSPDGQTLAYCHDRGTVDLWDVATERRARMLTFHGLDRINAVAYAPDGQTIGVSARARETGKFHIELHDLRNATTRHIGAHAASIRSLRFSPDGRYLASADVDDAVRVWDLTSGEVTLVDFNGNPEREPWTKVTECVSTPRGYTQSKGCVVWSPDSRMVAYTGFAPKRGSWQVIADPATGQALKRFDVGGGGIVAFSPDGSLFAICTGLEIQLFDCKSWRLQRTLTSHMRTINGMAFSPDARRLASTSKDQTILWNLATGVPVLTFETPTKRRYSSVAFTPDGTRLAIGGSSGRYHSIHIYRAATEEEVAANRSSPDIAPDMELAAACRNRNEWENAIQHYTRAIEACPNDQAPWRGRARCQFEAGQLDSALEDYQHVVQLWRTWGVPDSCLWDLKNELDQLGERWDASKQADKATQAYDLRLQAFELARNADVGEAQSHIMLAKRFAAQGETETAIEHVKQAVELYLGTEADEFGIRKNHVPGGVLQMLLDLLEKQDRLDEAVHICRKVAEREPENPVGHRMLGDALRLTGDDQAAVAPYRKAIALWEDGGGPHNNLALALNAIGDFDGEVEALETALGCAAKQVKAKPESSSARKRLQITTDNLASTYTTMCWKLATAPNPADRDPAKAVGLAKRALELAPDNSNHWSNLGVAEYRAGDFTAAVEALAKADALRDGKDLVHRMFFAMACWKSGDKSRARALYEEGAAWIQKHRSDNDEQQRFRAEAEELLGIAEGHTGPDNEPRPN